MTDRETKSHLKEVHTELRPHPGRLAKGDGLHASPKPRTPLDALPEVDDDTLDDLFNDMPV